MAIRNVQDLYKGPPISNPKYSDFAPSHRCAVGMLAGLESSIDSHTHLALVDSVSAPFAFSNEVQAVYVISYHKLYEISL
jgi:hypothetical protein